MRVGSILVCSRHSFRDLQCVLVCAAHRPNEFFANNWVYEGLVSYGADGSIKPSLAESWSVATRATGDTVITFNLRK